MILTFYLLFHHNLRSFFSFKRNYYTFYFCFSDLNYIIFILGKLQEMSLLKTRSHLLFQIYMCLIFLKLLERSYERYLATVV